MRIMKLLVVLVFVSGVFGEACDPVGWVDDNVNDCAIGCTEGGQLSYKTENQACGFGGDGHCMGSGAPNPKRCEPPATACPRISATEHAEAPEFKSGNFRRNGNFGLEFEVNCVFTTNAALVTAGTNLWTVKGGAQGAGVVVVGSVDEFRCNPTSDSECNAATDEFMCLMSFDESGEPCDWLYDTYPAPSGAAANHELITHDDDWGLVATFANDNSLVRLESGFTAYYVVIDFKGTTHHLWDYTTGQKMDSVEREVNEIFSLIITFKSETSVSQGIVQTYSVIQLEVHLETTIARTDATNVGVVAMDLKVDMVILTITNAPFHLTFDGTTSLGFSEFGGDALQLTYEGEIQTGDAGCSGPYNVSPLNGYTTLGDPCQQRWHFSSTLDLATKCQITQGILTFGQAGGVQCSEGTDNRAVPYVCPPLTPDTDDWNASVTVRTGDACPDFEIETGACAYLEIQDSNNVHQTSGFKIGDSFNIVAWVGAESSDNNAAASSDVYITTAAHSVVASPQTASDCVGSSCVHTYTFDQTLGTACSLDQIDLNALGNTAEAAKNPATDKTCSDHKYDCTHQKEFKFTSADYNLAVANNVEATIVFTDTITIGMSDGFKKSRVSVSTRDQFYALLQAGETANVRATAAAGMGAADAPETVEGAQAAPETGVQEELALTETSSNLVYIVVGILLVLSIAIAAVVMYMRRVKGAKKAQPVVPLPITIETTSASSTA